MNFNANFASWYTSLRFISSYQFWLTWLFSCSSRNVRLKVLWVLTWPSHGVHSLYNCYMFMVAFIDVNKFSSWCIFIVLSAVMESLTLAFPRDYLKRQHGYIRSGAVRQPVRFKHLRGTERPVAPHLTRLSSDRGHNRVQNLALK